jgi:hypothetical protein
MGKSFLFSLLENKIKLITHDEDNSDKLPTAGKLYFSDGS